MITSPDLIRSALLQRREWLGSEIEQLPTNANLQQLLGEVDAALDRLTTGRYGICESCSERIESDQLAVNPLRRFCFRHLAQMEQVKIVQDQEFGTRELDVIKLFPASNWSPKREFEECEAMRAMQVQRMLLPNSDFCQEPWEVNFVYLPAGPVGGDYCDIVRGNREELFLFFGDIMGKGFAASKISSQLNGVFRTLLDFKLPIHEMLERANRIFCERIQVIGYYATLVCIRAFTTGRVELVNAGHLPPLLLRPGGAERVAATGTPLGLFYSSKYDVASFNLAPGETLFFYTDGVTEARNGSDCEYGLERLEHLVTQVSHLAPRELVMACLIDVEAFASKTAQSDDLTVLALRRV